MLSEHERHHVFGLDALFLMGICCSLHAWFRAKSAFCADGGIIVFFAAFQFVSTRCSGNRMHSNMSVIMLWAWMLW